MSNGTFSVAPSVAQEVKEGVNHFPSQYRTAARVLNGRRGQTLEKKATTEAARNARRVRALQWRYDGTFNEADVFPSLPQILAWTRTLVTSHQCTAPFANARFELARWK